MDKGKVILGLFYKTVKEEKIEEWWEELDVDEDVE